MTKQVIQTMTAPPVTKEFAEWLSTAFRAHKITPKTPIETIMYQAGQQDVLDYINNVAYSGTIITSIDDRQTTVHESKLHKILGIFK
jgi:hypothetical protein